ncbi:G-protein coupled receptor 87-like [Trichomycterus rosablanca]|uniref:G-protein coupled receptor 87-like n=1 Tax=Trichomycterus rosablanca TaxID=2290929 RepID=UPI002F3592B3
MSVGASNKSSPSFPSSVVFASLYLFIFIAGLLLNSMALWVFLQIRTQKRTFMLYLRNMALADLLMTLTMPITVIEQTSLKPWWLPAISCRYTAVIFYCCMYANILFLGLVAVDRYLKIVRPFGGQFGNCLYSYSFTVAMAITAWLVMVTLSLPNTILTNQPVTPENASDCQKLKNEFGQMWHRMGIYINIVIFFLVLITLLFCYVTIYRYIRQSSEQFVIIDKQSQRKPKKGQNILVLLVVFSICFVPYHLWRVPFTQNQTNDVYSPYVQSILMCGKKVTLFLSSCNVCLDPIIYFFMCRPFRVKLAQTLGVWTYLENTLKKITTPERKTAVVLRFREGSTSV